MVLSNPSDRARQLGARVSLPPGRQVLVVGVGRQDAARVGHQAQAQLEDFECPFSLRHLARCCTFLLHLVHFKTKQIDSFKLRIFVI